MRSLQSDKIKATGDIPAPRFGHTLTMVSPNKAVLFGGAVSLSNKFVITNETFIYDLPSARWTKLNFKHDFVPSERAAHAAVAVSELQLIIYGGAASGNQGLLKDELYILDLRKDPVWKIIEVGNKSHSPGQRYGHCMLFSKPHLVVFGGNSGSRAENDVWLLNILKGPFTWQKCDFPNKVAPCPRVYHSAALCQEGSAYGMIVVFGGRKETKKDHNGSQKELTVAALNDIWGLRKHRDGSWDWVTPPKSESYSPIARYQHLVCFLGPMLVILGGRSNNPDEAVSQVEVYDTEKSEWHRVNSISRYRHAIAVYNKTHLLVHGGFEPQLAAQPLDTLISIDLAPLLKLSTADKDKEPQRKALTQNEPERKVLTQNDNLQNTYPFQNTASLQNNPYQIQNNLKMHKRGGESGGIQNERQGVERNSRMRSGTSTLNKTAKERDLTPSRIINSIKNIRLSRQAVVATGDSANMMQIQRVPLNSLLEESKKLITTQDDRMPHEQNGAELADSVLQTLLTQYKTSNSLFPFKKDKVVRLSQEAAKIALSQPSLVGVRAPVKIFGSIYGRFLDLLRMFENFGFPDDHELESNEYVFLGNYVDKGFNSLETVCLLMALKIKYPEHLTLLRGKHEDATLNRICGLGEECAIRLGENINDLSSAFTHINNFFDCLPLAAAIEDKFLCLNSGLGMIENLTEIKEVARPVKVRNNRVVMDLLWSGTKDEKRLNYEAHPSTDEEIEDFLQNHSLELLINTRDGLPHGLDEHGHTLSLFSVTNYNNSGNKAGMLKINKNLSLGPHLLNASPGKKGPWLTEVNVKSNLPLTSVEADIRSNIFQL